MPSGLFLLSYVTLQRLVELVIARRNTRALLAAGAYEVGAAHYPAMIALHATWLLTLWAFAWSHALVPGYLALVVVLQIGRYWVLRTLGKRWTTRIIMTPWAPPMTSGPFRFVRHPNYLIVAFELPAISLALGLPWHALVFGALNLLMIAWRIRSENAAFSEMAHRRNLLALLLVASGFLAATPGYGRALSFDVQQSEITVVVHKAGMFSFLADDHTVSAPIASGSYDSESQAVALTVDATKMRVLDPKLPPQKRDDVQANMIGPKVLDVAEYPTISFHSTTIADADPNHWTITGTLALRGQAHAITVHVLRKDATHFTGSGTVVQTAFGIAPIKIGGGVVSVKDDVTVEFSVTLAP